MPANLTPSEATNLGLTFRCDLDPATGGFKLLGGPEKVHASLAFLFVFYNRDYVYEPFFKNAMMQYIQKSAAFFSLYGASFIQSMSSKIERFVPFIGTKNLFFNRSQTNKRGILVEVDFTTSLNPQETSLLAIFFSE